MLNEITPAHTASWNIGQNLPDDVELMITWKNLNADFPSRDSSSLGISTLRYEFDDLRVLLDDVR